MPSGGVIVQLRADEAPRVRRKNEASSSPPPESSGFINPPTGVITMQWIQPQYEDLRYGFEITMYIAAR
jgi:coenzyme PQQ precursor peptide PqqA